MKKLIIILALSLILGISGNAQALITPNETTVNMDIHNAIDTLLGTAYGSNVAVNALQVEPDIFWHDFSTQNMPGGYIAIGVSAGNYNSLLVYDVNNNIPISTGLENIGGIDEFFGATFGTGTAADPYKEYSQSVFTNGENFGWILESRDNPNNAPQYTWDSDPSKNSDGIDHMLSYHLGDLAGSTVYLQTCVANVCHVTPYTFNDPFLIAWEDLPSDISDKDYNDMIYLVDRVAPIPEPLSMLLFGTGLAGLVGLRRKRS